MQCDCFRYFSRVLLICSAIERKGEVGQDFRSGQGSKRHPDISKEDAAHAWKCCIKSMQRVGKEPKEHVGIGYDATGRLVEVVAIRNNRGDWLIKHAQQPPQESIKRELGFGRRRK